eukprot:TRINITY_DN65250_c0_g1_i1.p1 TRINITY_DN65250_c0_g1~~TRINITY_DN65250_c0_g1_i1.p1  ORF type:complete len:472 (+),score=111.13 TRINITY_DN65250_c0_g1_i1:92-1417(+)
MWSTSADVGRFGHAFRDPAGDPVLRGRSHSPEASVGQGLDGLGAGPGGRRALSSGSPNRYEPQLPPTSSPRAASHTPYGSSIGADASRDARPQPGPAHRPGAEWEPFSARVSAQVSANPYTFGQPSYKSSLSSASAVYGGAGFRSPNAVRPPPQQQSATSFHGSAAAAPQASPRRQRIRGHSFMNEWQQDGPAGPPGRQRRASMVSAPGRHMLPPQAAQDAGKYTIVLDLDETLIYARDGPLYARPGVSEFLTFLGERCEGVAWTAGVRPYAQAVLRNIDHAGNVKHCIYRHAKWFSGGAGYTKDLKLLGRDLDRTLIVENTPDCIRHYPHNSILLADYERNELNADTQDETIPLLHRIISDLVSSRQTVPQFVRTCPLLTQKSVQTDVGDYISVNFLEVNAVAFDHTRINRDLPASPRQQPAGLGGAAPWQQPQLPPYFR